MSKLLNVMLAAGLLMTAGSAMAISVPIATTTTDWGSLTSVPGNNSASANGTYANSTDVLGFTFQFGGPASSANSNEFAIDASGGTTLAELWNTTTNTMYTPQFSSSGSSYFWAIALNTVDTYELFISGNTGDPYSVGATVAATPLPAAGLLFGTALLGMVGLGRKKGKTEEVEAAAA